MTGLDGRYVGLEITESAMVVAKQNLIEQLHDLKPCGVLDDFGMGHSSLSRRHRLPIDVLKIDRSFISELETEDGEMPGRS